MDSFDEKIGKTVSRRSGESDSIHDAGILLDTISRLRDGGLCPTGVYRFKDFDEAEQWALRHLARPD
ncbi:MAG TPA: hypothetical protein DCM05_07760 [Elusimicrobia bacterium]|nr:MAG: hypothetical protein A3J79_07720 [Elusimicrobia bacterium RIFOXYB2_FULL_62_6]HAH06407.1 hypothetical protein [Elusimicrobiota bacterium]